MAANTRAFLHPLHALLLAFPIVLFSGGLAADITYLNSGEIQWTNFAAWLIAFAMVFLAPVILWAIIIVWRWRSPRAIMYLLLLAVLAIIGLINNFHHSHDAWSSVGSTGLLLSIISTVLVLIAGLIAHSRRSA